MILILNLILFLLFGIFVKTKKLAWQANQNCSIYTLFLIIKTFFRSIETVFYKTSQNIPAWPNDLFLALQNSWEKKQTWHKKKKKKRDNIERKLNSLSWKNPYFCGFWETSTEDFKEPLHTKHLTMHEPKYNFSFFSSF